MKYTEYTEQLIDKFGKEYAKQSIINAIDTHTKINSFEPSEKCLTTIKFFQNCLSLFEINSQQKLF